MESFEPALRQALKSAHPGLTDAEIDEVEAALALRHDVDRRRRPDDASRADQRWRAAVARVPRLREVMLAFDRQQLQERAPRPATAVEVRPKP
jgi:hypothetical protein